MNYSLDYNDCVNVSQGDDVYFCDCVEAMEVDPEIAALEEKLANAQQTLKRACSLHKNEEMFNRSIGDTLDVATTHCMSDHQLKSLLNRLVRNAIQRAIVLIRSRRKSSFFANAAIPQRSVKKIFCRSGIRHERQRTNDSGGGGDGGDDEGDPDDSDPPIKAFFLPFLLRWSATIFVSRIKKYFNNRFPIKSKFDGARPLCLPSKMRWA